MKPYVVNAIYGFLLVLLSLIGYFSSGNPSPTAFIPTVFGVIFLALTLKMKSEHKIISHVVVVFTLVLLIALIKPFTGAIGRNDTPAQIRVGLMLFWGIVAMFVYIKSFIKAKRNKANGQ